MCRCPGRRCEAEMSQTSWGTGWMYGTTAWACRRGVAAWIQKWATEQVMAGSGFGADPQRGFGTAGFRFRTSPVVATLSRALLRMDVGMSSGSFPAFAEAESWSGSRSTSFRGAGFAAGRSTHRHWARSSVSTQRLRAMTWSWGVGTWPRV